MPKTVPEIFGTNFSEIRGTKTHITHWYISCCSNIITSEKASFLDDLTLFTHRRNEERPIDGAVLSKKHRDKDRRMCDSHENFCERHKNWFQYGEVYRPSSLESVKGTRQRHVKKCDRCTQTEVRVETTVKTVNVHTKDAPQEQKPSMVAESIAIYRRGFPTRKSAEFPRYKL